MLVGLLAIGTVAILPLAGCKQDASLHVTWTINGQPANGDRCNAVNALWVRVVEDTDNDGVVNEYSREMACSSGAGETVQRYESGVTTHIAFELLGLGSVVLDRVPATGFEAFTPEEGTNERTVDFTP
jgi:hypothetical protein